MSTLSISAPSNSFSKPAKKTFSGASPIKNSNPRSASRIGNQIDTAMIFARANFVNVL